jgi:hypothetical protein
MVGMDSNRLDANGVWPSLAAVARVLAEGRNRLSSLSYDRQLGSNDMSENNPQIGAPGDLEWEKWYIGPQPWIRPPARSSTCRMHPSQTSWVGEHLVLDGYGCHGGGAVGLARVGGWTPPSPTWLLRRISSGQNLCPRNLRTEQCGGSDQD